MEQNKNNTPLAVTIVWLKEGHDIDHASQPLFELHFHWATAQRAKLD